MLYYILLYCIISYCIVLYIKYVTGEGDAGEPREDEARAAGGN